MRTTTITHTITSKNGGSLTSVGKETAETHTKQRINQTAVHLLDGDGTNAPLAPSVGDVECINAGLGGVVVALLHQLRPDRGQGEILDHLQCKQKEERERDYFVATQYR